MPWSIYEFVLSTILNSPYNLRLFISLFQGRRGTNFSPDTTQTNSENKIQLLLLPTARVILFLTSYECRPSRTLEDKKIALEAPWMLYTSCGSSAHSEGQSWAQPWTAVLSPGCPRVPWEPEQSPASHPERGGFDWLGWGQAFFFLQTQMTTRNEMHCPKIVLPMNKDQTNELKMGVPHV